MFNLIKVYADGNKNKLVRKYSKYYVLSVPYLARTSEINNLINTFIENIKNTEKVKPKKANIKRYSNAQQVFIFNNKNELVYICNESFKKFYKKHNIPKALWTSTKTLRRLKVNVPKEYKGWFAIKIPKDLKNKSEKLRLQYCTTLFKQIDKNTSDNDKLISSNIKKAKNYPIIEIYDNHNNLKFKCENITFKTYCKNKNLPFETFVKSYLNNTKVQFNLNNKCIFNRLTNNGNIKYNAWKAVKILRG